MKTKTQKIKGWAIWSGDFIYNHDPNAFSSKSPLLVKAIFPEKKFAMMWIRQEKMIENGDPHKIVPCLITLLPNPKRKIHLNPSKKIK